MKKRNYWSSLGGKNLKQITKELLQLIDQDEIDKKHKRN